MTLYLKRSSPHGAVFALRALRRVAESVVVAALSASVLAQTDADAAAKRLFEQEQWQQLADLGRSVSAHSAEFDYEYGVALARLERWDEAHTALLAGSRLSPTDKRFPIELAGVAFKQKKTARAIAYLHRALRLDPEDAYANDFLATVYSLQGNLEAALQYWNRLEPPKPRVERVQADPEPRLRPALLDHAFAFAPASTLALEELRASEARVQTLGIFPNYRFDLAAEPDGSFTAVFNSHELNGWGSTKVEGLIRTFRGLPFQEITPEYFNLNRSAINLSALARWDPDKRRYRMVISAPFSQDPRWRFVIDADWRDENWDLVTSFTGPSTLLAALNLRRESFSAGVTRLVGARWKWSAGGELSHRDERNIVAGSALTPALLAQGYQLKQEAAVEYQLLRDPERRLTVATGAESQAGRLWSSPSAWFEKLQASLQVHWLPLSRGDDFDTQWKVRAGKTFGAPPFDELYMLGLERDNDLWMRAHIGTRDGRKGSAPLGRDYSLSNWECDKNLYSIGLITVKMGPFVDTGRITDASALLGSRKWLWDTGAQAKVRVLGVGAVFSYGKDLRSGNNAFYVTLAR